MDYEYYQLKDIKLYSNLKSLKFYHDKIILTIKYETDINYIKSLIENYNTYFKKVNCYFYNFGFEILDINNVYNLLNKYNSTLFNLSIPYTPYSYIFSESKIKDKITYIDGLLVFIYKKITKTKTMIKYVILDSKYQKLALDFRDLLEIYNTKILKFVENYMMENNTEQIIGLLTFDKDHKYKKEFLINLINKSKVFDFELTFIPFLYKTEKWILENISELQNTYNFDTDEKKQYYYFNLKTEFPEIKIYLPTIKINPELSIKNKGNKNYFVIKNNKNKILKILNTSILSQCIYKNKITDIIIKTNNKFKLLNPYFNFDDYRTNPPNILNIISKLFPDTKDQYVIVNDRLVQKKTFDLYFIELIYNHHNLIFNFDDTKTFEDFLNDLKDNIKVTLIENYLNLISEFKSITNIEKGNFLHEKYYYYFITLLEFKKNINY